jgi:NADPH:quinone reductase-like Zn-dependent oxidoreductase/2-polyprenyl-6-methoxyphenol hydroxylase-like FAD-dependent oxidoreductase
VIQNAAWARDQQVTFRVCNQLLNGNSLVLNKLSSWGDIVDKKPGCKFLFYREGMSVSPPLMCPQTSLEPALKEHLDRKENVSMLWGWEVASLEQDANGATLTIVSGEGEDRREKQIRAKFVVACDGGSSPLRKLLNVHTYGDFVFARAVSMMIRSNEVFDRIQQITGPGLFVVINQQFVAVFVNVKVKGEFATHIVLPRGTTDEKVNDIVSNPSRYIDMILGERVAHTVSVVSAYSMHGLVTTEFGVGRCFFAGDSAHQWVPAGGLGLNTGIGDVFNLTWKIAAVLKGYGGPQLLKSYEVERKPVCDLTRRYAMTLAKTAGSGGNTSVLTGIIVSSPIITSILRKFFNPALDSRLAAGQKYVFGLEYPNSNVVVHEHNPNGKQYLSITTEKFAPTSFPGQRAPHVALSDQETILDLFGNSFVLLVIGGQKTDCVQLRHELEKRNVPFSTHAYSKFTELVALYDRKYFLVRPDGVICWRSDVQPSAHEARRIVSIVLGDCPPQRLSPFHPQKTSSPFASFVLDMVLASGIGSLLHKYAGLDFKASFGIGLGLFWFLRRRKITPQIAEESTGRHKAAVINGFGNAEDVFQVDSRYTQKFREDDILIRVRAVSINPIDVKIRRGYIASLLNRVARLKGASMFPILLGRDCSGEVVAVGDNVTKFVSGDEVYALSGFSGGTYAQFAVVSAESAALKPKTIDHREAASISFVAATAYSALVENVGLSRTNTRGKKVLVHGGTGGVGSFAVQLLKAWGATVAVTCSAENASLARSLGADKVIDYKTSDFTREIQDYDVVLDTIGGSGYERRSLKVLKMYGGASYVTIVTPKVTFLSKFPPILGAIAYSWFYRFKIITNRILGGRGFYYSTANPSGKILEVVSEMVDRGEIKPVIDAVYGLDEIVAAHQHVEEGHTRGKVVVTMP